MRQLARLASHDLVRSVSLSHMTIDQLKPIIQYVRGRIENVRGSISFNGYSFLNDYPRGCCTIASKLVILYLFHKLDIPPQKLSLLSTIKGSDIRHDWVLYGNIHIDITGDQLSNDPVIVSEISPWPQYDYRRINYDPRKENDLLSIFAYLYASKD